jgi:hypothetical protein
MADRLTREDMEKGIEAMRNYKWQPTPHILSRHRQEDGSYFCSCGGLHTPWEILGIKPEDFVPGPELIESEADAEARLQKAREAVAKGPGAVAKFILGEED